MRFLKLSLTLHPQFIIAHAQMAELVDALVSNTNAARRAGSIPALGTFIIAHAQMAELVDALVSNTNAARRAGSIPALGTFQSNSKSRKQLILRHLRDFSFYNNPLFAPQVYPYIFPRCLPDSDT